MKNNNKHNKLETEAEHIACRACFQQPDGLKKLCETDFHSS